MLKFLHGRGFDCNSILLIDEKICLVDPGLGQKPIKVPRAQVNLVVNTHAHYDHIADDFLFANARVFMHEKDLVLLDDCKVTCEEHFEASLHKTKIEKLGKELVLGRMRLEVIHTPGHTPGSVCLFDPLEKALICGDLAFIGGIGRADLPGGNAEDLAKSLLKISKLNFETFYPGHGPLGTKEDFLRSAGLR